MILQHSPIPLLTAAPDSCLRTRTSRTLNHAAWPIVRYATAGVFEETLLCDKRMTAQLAALPSRFDDSILEAWAEEL